MHVEVLTYFRSGTVLGEICQLGQQCCSHGKVIEAPPWPSSADGHLGRSGRFMSLKKSLQLSSVAPALENKHGALREKERQVAKEGRVIESPDQSPTGSLK